MINKVEIIDNFCSKELIEILHKYSLKLPHYYGHQSNKGSNELPFYSSNLDIEKDVFVELLFDKIKNLYQHNIELLRSYFNIQHKDMDGSFHTDDGNLTFLLMVSESLEKDEGAFEIKKTSESKIHKINFVQNRLIAFPAQWFHRGRDGKAKKPRITLAFKTYVK